MEKNEKNLGFGITSWVQKRQVYVPKGLVVRINFPELM